ncbi:predicted protein, partial [Postia placenta Mad-698-R]
PKFGMCCLQGQVQLPPVSQPPGVLQRLFKGTDPCSHLFQENIRQYNSAFAFTSVAVTVDHDVLNGSGPYSFRIHGGLYHRMGTLLPNNNIQPLYAQLYIHDPHAALQTCMLHNPNLDPGIMNEIQDLLLTHNPFVPLYKRAYEILVEKPPEEQLNVSAQLQLQESDDHWRYNLPTVDEVAAIIPGSGDEDVDEHRDVILRLRTGELKQISHIHPLYSPLHYVLLFPQ